MNGAHEPSAPAQSASRGPYLAVTTGALGIAWAPIFVALSGASPVAVTFWRYAYALPVLAGLVALRPRARATFRIPGWKGLALIAGGLFTVDLVLWHRAIGLIGAGPATLLANTHVVWITLFGLVALHEVPGRAFWIALPGLACGMWLLVGGDLSGIPLEADRRGLVYGLGTGLAYSGVLICIRAGQRGRELAPESFLSLQITAGLLALIPLTLIDPEPVVRLGWEAHIWLLPLGVGIQVLSWWAITAGLPRIRGYHGSVLLFAQPVGSVLLGWWVLGQALPPTRLLGAGIILAAIALTVMGDRRD